jgi:NTP pyrophosphatase (non-canonical NTP hydrolase)
MGFECAWNPAAKAVEVFGAEQQKLVAIGEMGELMTAMSDHERGRKTVHDIADEIADVEQVLEELKIIYGIRRDVLLAKPRKAKKLAYEIIAEMEKKNTDCHSASGASQ